MKKIISILMITLALSLAVSAQTATPTAQTASTKTSKPPIFRANKDGLINNNK